jgi:hypothetical protein
MKKLLLLLVTCFFIGCTIGQTPTITIQQVGKNSLKTAPLGSYALMTTEEFNALLKSGYENNHGTESHEFGFKGEKPLFWVEHPDGFVEKKTLVFTYEFTEDGQNITVGPVKIVVPYNTVLLFKKGSYTFANSLDAKGPGWWTNTEEEK